MITRRTLLRAGGCALVAYAGAPRFPLRAAPAAAAAQARRERARDGSRRLLRVSPCPGPTRAALGQPHARGGARLRLAGHDTLAFPRPGLHGEREARRGADAPRPRAP